MYGKSGLKSSPSLIFEAPLRRKVKAMSTLANSAVK